MKTLFITCLIFISPSLFAESKIANTPEKACTTLVEAAKKDDFKAYTSVSLSNPHSKMMRKEGHFDNMSKDYMGKIKSITCGNATIVGDHAFVEATSEGKKRLIPFRIESQQWKFDPMTYRSFYSVMPMGKSMKKTM